MDQGWSSFHSKSRIYPTCPACLKNKASSLFGCLRSQKLRVSLHEAKKSVFIVDHLTTLMEVVWPSNCLTTAGHSLVMSADTKSLESFLMSKIDTSLSFEPVAIILVSVLDQSTVLMSSVCTRTAFYTGFTVPLAPPTLMSQNSTYLSTPTDTNSEGESFLNTKSSIFPEWPCNLRKG